MLVLCKFANGLDPKETPWKDSRRLPGQGLHDWSRIRPCRIEGASPLHNLRHQDTDLEDFHLVLAAQTPRLVAGLVGAARGPALGRESGGKRAVLRQRGELPEFWPLAVGETLLCTCLVPSIAGGMASHANQR